MLSACDVSSLILGFDQLFVKSKTCQICHGLTISFLQSQINGVPCDIHSFCLWSFVGTLLCIIPVAVYLKCISDPLHA